MMAGIPLLIGAWDKMGQNVTVLNENGGFIRDIVVRIGG